MEVPATRFGDIDLGLRCTNMFAIIPLCIVLPNHDSSDSIFACMHSRTKDVRR